MTDENSEVNISVEFEINREIKAIQILKHISDEAKAALINDLMNKKKIKDMDLVKESEEIVTKSLEFDNNTFKINSEGWEEATEESAKKNPNLKKFLDKGIKIKANATGDVIEHMEDTVNGDLKCKKGEQLFIFDYRVTFERERFLGYIAKAKGCSIEEVENKYFLTLKEFKEKMKDKPSHSEEYKKFFNEEVNGHLAGSWAPAFAENFRNIGEGLIVWLAGDYCGAFRENNWGWNNNNHSHGLSVRLLKN